MRKNTLGVCIAAFIGALGFAGAASADGVDANTVIRPVASTETILTSGISTIVTIDRLENGGGSSCLTAVPHGGGSGGIVAKPGGGSGGIGGGSGDISTTKSGRFVTGGIYLADANESPRHDKLQMS